MALTQLTDLLHKAEAGGYAVGYFEAWDPYSMEACVEAAEAEHAPILLGFGGMMMEQRWLDRFGVEPLGAYALAIARRTNLPVALILNEVWDEQHAQRGAQCGFNTVMLNTCDLPLEENIAKTRSLVEFSHPLSVEVQAELGRLPTIGEDETRALTDPDEAAYFIKETGVDCLAVSIGNAHLRTEGKDTVDLERLRAIRSKVDVPLVIHGGSGLPANALSGMIDAGVSLFHVGTVMKKLFFHAAQDGLRDMETPYNYQELSGSRKEGDFLAAGKAAVRNTVRGLIQQFGASGRA